MNGQTLDPPSAKSRSDGAPSQVFERRSSLEPEMPVPGRQARFGVGGLGEGRGRKKRRGQGDEEEAFEVHGGGCPFKRFARFELRSATCDPL
jgi:hypothetical protein